MTHLTIPKETTSIEMLFTIEVEVANGDGRLARGKAEGKDPRKTKPRILKKSSTPYRNPKTVPRYLRSSFKSNEGLSAAVQMAVINATKAAVSRGQRGREYMAVAV
jgi:hypothetical protein